MATGWRSLQPLQVSRSRRRDAARAVTTAKAGRIIPLQYIPLLREDRLANCQVTVGVEMAETVRPLANAVYAHFEAWFFPFAALPRFDSLVDFNRAYTKTAGPSGVPPFIQPAAFAANDIYKSLGIHHVVGAMHNPMLIEIYNALVNFMYGDRSPSITERLLTNTTLATGFWAANRFSHVVPNYDRSFIDGTVPVAFPANPPVRGIGMGGRNTAPAVMSITESGVAGSRNMTGWKATPTAGAASETILVIEDDPAVTTLAVKRPLIRVDLGATQANISLANIDLARQEAAFDSLRNKYSGKNDDDIVELLMQGIAVPEELERQPWLLAARTVQMGFATRFATDGANLEDSLTAGRAGVTFNLNMPKTNTGGVVFITAQVVPDQMFERRRDPFIMTTDHDLWPQYERDTLDTEKVDNVLNADVDTSHATPGGLFGYEPMNHKWNRDFIRIGGEMYRPSATTPWVEDRAALWVTEPINPTLSEDFYLAKSVNAQPFKDQVSDHLTIITTHEGVIEGNTVFGPPLTELAPP